MKVGAVEIEVVAGSVLDQPVAAIVNAANPAMRGGGALDGAIHRAAGPGLLAELVRVAPRGAATAEVVVTAGHALAQAWVLHVAGPVWRDAEAAACDELLARSYRGCFAEADRRAIATLGVPSLSTGVFGFPIARAAPIAVGEAIAFARAHPATAVRRICFAMYGATEHAAFADALATAVR